MGILSLASALWDWTGRHEWAVGRSDLEEIGGGRVLGQGTRGASGGLWKISSESPAQIRSSLPFCVFVLHVRVCMCVLACVHVGALAHVEDNVRCLPQDPSQPLKHYYRAMRAFCVAGLRWRGQTWTAGGRPEQGARSAGVGWGGGTLIHRPLGCWRRQGAGIAKADVRPSERQGVRE